jgi:CHAT domain-containing protein
LGLSYLKTGRTQAGISIIENFFGEIKKADLLEEKKAKDRIRVLQKIDEQKIKNAETFQIVSSILSSAVNIGGNIAATRVLSQNYSTMNQAYAAMDKTQLISNVSKLASNVINMTASLQASRAALMADTQNKLSGYISSLVLEVVRYLNKYEQVELYVEIAHGYKKVGNKAMAIKYFKEAIGIIELQRSTISAETQRINFDDIKEHLYSELISLLIETNKPKEAFRYVEKIKSRAMLDVLSRREIVLRSEDETESFNAIMKEREEIASLLNHSKLSIEQLGMIEKKGTRGVKILSTLKKGIEFELLATGKTVAFSTAAELSKGDFSILEYFTTDSAIIIFLFDRGTLFVKVMPIKKQGLYDLINVFRMELSDNKNLNSKDDSADKLYELLISPVLDHISQKRLYIVPHGWLHYIPYQALKRNSRYLVEEFAITYVPSVTILKTLHDRNMKTNASIFIIGNPNVGDSLYDLKYAEEEAVSIGMKFGNKDKKVLVREYATETMFKEYSYKYDVVHIAAHAFFNCDNPLHSYILLRGDEKNDGRLYANEFYKMKLSSSLLTMSACNTGLSYVSKGDEIIGLNRGVMYAGVDSIVSSLWNVDDRSTAYLMSIFYQNLTKMPKDIALQKAQIHTIKSFPNPYAWAPFVLSGKKD